MTSTKINEATPEDWDSAYRKVTDDPELKPRDPAEMQIGGDHYTNKTIQPIEYITANRMSFSEGNIIKYITRHKEKNGIEDVRKAIHYCKLILKYEYGDEWEN